ncbi:type II toxin-antitoxin system HicB family antitoxin [Patescibacteria group bacterium]|nr:type II toxin-antitoxin system HicB family antitoxin [Patescibacteria group bacterium]
MRKIDIHSVTWKEGKHYVSQCLNIDIASFGPTEAKALANLKEAVELYLDDNKTHKPTEVKKPRLASMKLAYA